MITYGLLNERVMARIEEGQEDVHIPIMVDDKGVIQPLDIYNNYAAEFLEWRDAGHVPTTAPPRWVPPAPLDFGSQPDDDRTQIQQVVTLLNAYIQNNSPTAAERKQFENAMARAMKDVLRRVT
jgi:hypothetical protein